MQKNVYMSKKWNGKVVKRYVKKSYNGDDYCCYEPNRKIKVRVEEELYDLDVEDIVITIWTVAIWWLLLWAILS